MNRTPNKRTLLVMALGLAVALVSLSACDGGDTDGNDLGLRLSQDADFKKLNALLADRAREAAEAAGKNGAVSSAAAALNLNSLMRDPEIQALAQVINARFPDLDTSNASEAVAQFRREMKAQDSSATSLSKAEDPCSTSYYYCLASVSGAGVAMMAGCATTGPFAVVCGAGVIVWTAAESGKCQVAAQQCAQQGASNKGLLPYDRSQDLRDHTSVTAPHSTS